MGILERFECNIAVEPRPLTNLVMELTDVSKEFIMSLQTIGIEAENIRGPGELNIVMWHREDFIELQENEYIFLFL